MLIFAVTRGPFVPIASLVTCTIISDPIGNIFEISPGLYLLRFLFELLALTPSSRSSLAASSASCPNSE